MGLTCTFPSSRAFNTSIIQWQGGDCCCEGLDGMPFVSCCFSSVIVWAERPGTETWTGSFDSGAGAILGCCTLGCLSVAHRPPATAAGVVIVTGTEGAVSSPVLESMMLTATAVGGRTGVSELRRAEGEIEILASAPRAEGAEGRDGV